MKIFQVYRKANRVKCQYNLTNNMNPLKPLFLNRTYSDSPDPPPSSQTTVSLSNSLTWSGGFPGGAMVKNPPANAGDTGLSPGPGRSHMLLSN